MVIAFYLSILTVHTRAYENRLNRYNIDFPQSWKIENSSESGVFAYPPEESADAAYIEVYVQDLEEIYREQGIVGTNLSAAELLEAITPEEFWLTAEPNFEESLGFDVIYSEGNYKYIDNQKAGWVKFAISGFTGFGQIYYIPKDGKFYVISTLSLGDSEGSNDINTLNSTIDRSVGSFKFSGSTTPSVRLAEIDSGDSFSDAASKAILTETLKIILLGLTISALGFAWRKIKTKRK